MGGGILAALLSLVWIGLIRGGHPGAGGLLLALTWLAWLALAAFFRAPERSLPEDRAALVAPADGVVRDIGEVRDHGIEPLAGRSLVRVGIFLSVFDVHVNRAPCDLTVVSRQYRKGRFLDARDPRCSRENESLVLVGAGQTNGRSFPVAVRQISGAIARRIVCAAKPGDTLPRGGAYGMIKFGSRTELYFPADSGIRVCVKVGLRVRAGNTPIARADPPEPPAP